MTPSATYMYFLRVALLHTEPMHFGAITFSFTNDPSSLKT